MDAGVTINRPPRDGYMAFVRSPDNISIELLQKRRGEAARRSRGPRCRTRGRGEDGLPACGRAGILRRPASFSLNETCALRRHRDARPGVSRSRRCRRGPEKYRAHELVVTGGGTAANGAVAIARLGGAVSLYGALGEDPHRRRDRRRTGAGGRSIARACGGSPGVRSPLSAIFVDRAGERMIISYADRTLPGRADWLPERLPDGVDAVLGDTRWQEGSAHFFRLAREAGVPAILDGDRAP